MRRLKTVRRPPIYPKTPGHLPCSSLTHPLPLSSRRPSVSFGGFGIRRVGFSLKVKREKMEEYKQRHKSVWPEMLEALSRNGWHNYSLFIQDDGQLFGYFEAEESLNASLEGTSKEDVNRRCRISWHHSLS